MSNFQIMGDIPMGNVVPMIVKVYPKCLFQMPNILLPYALLDPLKWRP